MNKDTAKDYLPLVQALADGKVLQVLKWRGAGSREWEDIGDPDFRNTAAEYRIKPEPVGPDEVWLVITPNTTWNSAHDAERLSLKNGGTVVRYRRVEE